MDTRRHNADLFILQHEHQRPRFGAVPGWVRVDWKPTDFGGNMIVVRGLLLPLVCRPARTHVKIEAPPNLYEPAPGGGFHFYRNIWVTPGLKVWDHRTKRWHIAPRLFNTAGEDGFAYLCVHPRFATEKDNIL